MIEIPIYEEFHSLYVVMNYMSDSATLVFMSATQISRFIHGFFKYWLHYVPPSERLRVIIHMDVYHFGFQRGLDTGKIRKSDDIESCGVGVAINEFIVIYCHFIPPREMSSIGKWSFLRTWTQNLQWERGLLPVGFFKLVGRLHVLRWCFLRVRLLCTRRSPTKSTKSSPRELGLK